MLSVPFYVIQKIAEGASLYVVLLDFYHLLHKSQVQCHPIRVKSYLLLCQPYERNSPILRPFFRFAFSMEKSVSTTQYARITCSCVKTYPIRNIRRMKEKSNQPRNQSNQPVLQSIKSSFLYLHTVTYI